MYNVQLMKRFTSSQARRQIADLLDAAEAGERVVIERRGVSFELGLRGRATKRAARPHFDLIDPAVTEGTWSWRWTGAGVAFKKPKRRR
jgi:hypothetical protein